MAKVRFDRVSKLFGQHAAVADLNFEVSDGEFLVLVGPSGCGKTTTLRMRAGLETPTYGRIWMDDRDVTLLPPGRRDIAMVFQSYALYPHMSVYRNLAFGPEVRREPKQQLAARVHKVAEVLGLSGMLDRRPSALSGGQRQRIALGRAMIRAPRLFLLDEPLSNLDAALRTQMRLEIAELQRRLNVTAVYVTHDQVEAMTMGHRIAVFSHGRVLQLDSPQELYLRPKSRMVATFIGSPQMNILPGELSSQDSRVLVSCVDVAIPLTPAQARASRAMPSKKVEIGLRPQHVHWLNEAPPRCTQRIQGVVGSVEPTGAETFVMVTVADQRINARFPSFAQVSIGDQVDLAFDVEDLHLFNPETGASLLDGMEEGGRRSVLQVVQGVG
jgi:multiple sugar transport system ATP-binding protein